MLPDVVGRIGRIGRHGRPARRMDADLQRAVRILAP